MAFTLTIKGAETLTYGKTIISSANVSIDTPNDARAKSTHVAITLYIAGKLLAVDDDAIESNSPTNKLFEWALLPAIDKDVYRDVTVRIQTEAIYGVEGPFRDIHLPHAFVVNYNERYSDTRGVGEFSLTLRQKADKLIDVKPLKS